ncbi:uncharacterized protein LOC122923994, partial [Bufo gargarizans]|uniref:uncharacterized protein LOC122923994 n=1 Tax=Bufo gargarizans TaxID=30331 RepID=UPI001CF3FEC5
MSSPGNGVNLNNYGFVHYRPSGYPGSYSVQPTNQQQHNYSPPPAYDTIDRLPTWSEENSYLNTPQTTEIWIRRTENNLPSTSQESTMPPNVQQAPCPLCNTPSISPELSETSALSHQNSTPVVSRTIDFKQVFRNFRPQFLGGVLIITSILQISLGILVTVSRFNHGMISLWYGTLFWVPAFHFFAGTMLILSWTNISTASVKCVLCISILSFIASGVGLALNISDLNDLRCFSSGFPFICNKLHKSYEISKKYNPAKLGLL